MADEKPTKKGLAARLLSKIGGASRLSDPESRDRAIGEAVEAYFSELESTGDAQRARACIEALAAEFAAEGLATCELYAKAHQARKDDLHLLKLYIAELESYEQRGVPKKETVEAYWALATAEPADLTHFYPLIDYYRSREDTATLLRLEEQIVERMREIRAGLLEGPRDPAANEEIGSLALADLSAAYSEMGRTDDKALLVYEEQFFLDSNDNDTLAMLASCYSQRKRHDARALDVYEKYFVLAPEDRETQRLLIEAYFEQGNPEKAIVLMERLFQQSTEDFGLLSRIVHYYRTHQLLTESVIRRFEQYAEFRPEDEELPHLIAEFFATHQELSDRAAGWYRKVLADPREDRVYRQLLARYHMLNEEWEKSYEILLPMKKSGLLQGDALLAFATTAARLGLTDPESALLYERAIAEGSRSGLIYNMLARAYLEAERFENSTLRHFEATIQLDPTTPHGYEGIARYYARLDEPQNAFYYAVKHVGLNPEDLEGRRLAGEMLSRLLLEEYFEAITHLSDDVVADILLATFEKTSNDARVLLPLAKRLVRLPGREIEKLRAYRALLELYPDDIFLLEELRALAASMDESALERETERRLALCGLRPALKTEFGKSENVLQGFVDAAILREADLILPKKQVTSEEEEILRLAARHPWAGPEIHRKVALLAADRNEIGAEVIPIYEKAVEDSPELLALKHLLMQSYISVGMYEPVFEHATELLLDRPYNAIVLSLVIECLMNHGAYDPDLHELIRTHYRHRVTDAKTTLAYAMFNYRAGCHDREALIVYERALEYAGPEQAMLLRSALARCYDEAGEYVRAERTYQEILETIPDDLEIIRRLATSNIRSGDTRTSSGEVIVAALKDGPYDTEVYFRLLDVYINRRKPLVAQFLIDRISRHAPSEMERLVPLLKKAARLGIGGPPLILQLAEYHYLNGDKEEALRLLDRIEQITPRVADQVIELYNVMLARNADDLEVRRRRGEMHHLAGATAPAAEDLMIYWEHEGKKRPLPSEFLEIIDRFLAENRLVSPRLLLLLARSFYHAGRFQECVRVCRRVLSQSRNHPEALFLCGCSLYHRKDLEGARRAFDRLPHHANTLEWLYRLACDYERAGAFDDALSLYNRILGTNPDYRDCSDRAHRVGIERLNQRDSRSGIDREFARELRSRTHVRYEPVGQIGRSPIFTIFRAYDRDLDEIVALKVLNPILSQDEQASRIFVEETRRVQRLVHPNVLRIREVYAGSGAKFYSTEYAERGSLWKLRKKGQIRLYELLIGLQQVAEGLSHAHQMGVYHGGLTPHDLVANQFNVVKITDFGLHRLLTPEILAPQLVIQRPYFQAPERFLDERPSAFGDIYSFGASAYALLSGMPPFPGPNLEEQHLHQPAPRLTGMGPDLAEAIGRCLAKKPEDRPQDMRQVAQELREARVAASQSGAVA